MLQLKHELSIAQFFLPVDAMMLVKKVWDKSFDRKETNRKVTSERGWCPCNHALLKHPNIRATMKPDENLEELSISTCFDENNSEVPSLTDICQQQPQPFCGTVRMMKTMT